MLASAWYIAAAVEDLAAHEPMGVEIGGRKLVLFRTPEGAVACLADQCCHRGVPLSMGVVKEDGIACAAHGWRFDSGGRCTHIPSLMPAETIPPNAAVTSYVVAERQGYYWVWMGDGEAAGVPDALSVPELTANGFCSLKIRIGLDCNYVDAIENLIDVTHVPYVHVFPHLPEDERILLPRMVEVTAEEWGVSLLGGIPRDGSLSTGSTHTAVGNPEIRIRFVGPNMVRLEFLKAGPGEAIAMIEYFIPVSEWKTIFEVILVFRARNPDNMPKAIRINHLRQDDRFHTTGRLGDEDAAIMLAQARTLRANPNFRGVCVAGDAMIIAYRKFKTRARRQSFKTSQGETRRRCLRTLCNCAADTDTWPPNG